MTVGAHHRYPISQEMTGRVLGTRTRRALVKILTASDVDLPFRSPAPPPPTAKTQWEKRK